MTTIEKADKILAKYEDDNEYHFHKCDREWLIIAMVELAESEVKIMTRKEYQQKYQKEYAANGKKKAAQKRYYKKHKYEICDRLKEKRAKLFENKK